jgi:hypothetical protein
MITLDQAKKLSHGDILHHCELRNADGTPQRWRVSGKVKRWKRTPDRIEIPIKRGLYQFDYLTENYLNEFCLTAEIAMEV